MQITISYIHFIKAIRVFRPMHNVWEAIYFVFSFTYLVGRTCAVSLYAASINDQSKKPKAILFSVPTESYGVEVNINLAKKYHRD